MPFGVRNPYYASAAWLALRAEKLAEADYTCECCGRRQEKGQHVHHVLGLGVDPNGRELAVLDRTCHDTVEILARRKGRLTVEMVEALLTLVWRKLAGPGARVEVTVKVKVNGRIVKP